MLEIKRGIDSTAVKGAMENFVVCDIPGFADFVESVPSDKRKAENRSWYGGMSYTESLKATRTGDLRGVPESDRFLTQMEHLVPVGTISFIENCVAGGVPNVPAFLAGVPLDMRRRVKRQVNTSPLVVVADLVASGGVDAADMHKRGAAVLALVRLLANVRPVELYALVALGNGMDRTSLVIRLDTAPLDLARVAHVLTHPSVARALGYRSLQHHIYNGGWHGSWAFDDCDTHRRTAAECYRQHVSHGAEVFYIPPIYLRDEAVNNPVQWIKGKLAEYGGLELAA
jgi:hypothetical protein